MKEKYKCIECGEQKTLEEGNIYDEGINEYFMCKECVYRPAKILQALEDEYGIAFSGVVYERNE